MAGTARCATAALTAASLYSWGWPTGRPCHQLRRRGGSALCCSGCSSPAADCRARRLHARRRGRRGRGGIGGTSLLVWSECRPPSCFSSRARSRSAGSAVAAVGSRSTPTRRTSRVRSGSWCATAITPPLVPCFVAGFVVAVLVRIVVPLPAALRSGTGTIQTVMPCSPSAPEYVWSCFAAWASGRSCSGRSRLDGVGRDHFDGRCPAGPVTRMRHTDRAT